LGPLAGRGHGGVAPAELGREPGRPDPGAQRSAPPGQDRPEQQARQARGTPGVQRTGQIRKPVAPGGRRMRGWHGPVRSVDVGRVVTPSSRTDRHSSTSYPLAPSTEEIAESTVSEGGARKCPPTGVGGLCYSQRSLQQELEINALAVAEDVDRDFIADEI